MGDAQFSVTKSSCNGDMYWGGRPTACVALIFATFGFGTDRFYVGQAPLGVALLISYLLVFGMLVGIPVSLLSAFSLVVMILSDRQTAFMYGRYVIFERPTITDKVVAVLWISLMIFLIGVGIVYAIIKD